MKNLGVFDKFRVLIYRYHEKGLEIFLVEPRLAEDASVWKLPHSLVENQPTSLPTFDGKDIIHLDSVTCDENCNHHTIAVEGDWHDIPSIRGMVKHDLNRVKSKIKEVLPDMEKGTYVAAKGIVKKVLPHEYKAIKELKDILLERNQSYY